jgi:hypothetical protein
MLSQCHAQLVGGCLHVLRFLFLDGKQAIVAIPRTFQELRQRTVLPRYLVHHQVNVMQRDSLDFVSLSSLPDKLGRISSF